MNPELLTRAAETIERVANDQREHSERVTELDARMRQVEQVVAERGANFNPRRGVELRFMSALAEEPRFDMLRKGATSTGRIALQSASIKTLRKAALLSLQGGGESTGYDVPAERLPGLYGHPAGPVDLLDVLPAIPVTSNTFEFVRVDNYVNAADVQAVEAEPKAEASVPTSTGFAAIVTVAHWLRASNQVLEDVPLLEQQIGQLLGYGLLQKLENEVINGTGAGIVGLVDQSTAYTPSTSAAAADAVGEAIAHLRSLGWVPGLVVLNPMDWFAIASERGANGYVAGGWAVPAPPTIWGVPVVVSSSLTAGSALVLDPAQTLILDRMAPTVMLSREDGSNFTTNQTTILAELRAGLAVLAPSAVLQVAIST